MISPPSYMMPGIHVTKDSSKHNIKIMKMSLQQETMFRSVHNFTHAMRVESFMTFKTLTWFNHCNPNPAEKFSWDFNYELKISMWNQSLTILGQRHWWKDEPGWHDNISKRSCAGHKINRWAYIIMVIKVLRVIGGFPPKRASNMEKVSMPCCHHWFMKFKNMICV